MKLLDRKSLIVTGASSGIGRAASLLFSRHGARLVLVARNPGPLSALADEVCATGGEAVCCVGDVALEDTHRRAVAAAVDAYDGLDLAFNNAGMVGDISPLADCAVENWEQVIATNLTSAFLAVRAQVPAMLKNGGGALVLTSSFVGSSVGLPGMGAYAASKAGLGGLVKALAADYAHKGVRANALLPGGTDTPMAGSEENKEWAAGLHPVRRIAQPEEIANAALFLLSDMASFVCGSALWADGGNSATKVQAA
jgi:NAD(P)-dependent dehydrogenase (short-subunit alcohol dehydrogenase family)